MKNLFLLLVMLFAFYIPSRAQNPENHDVSKNTTYLEFGTNYIVSSVFVNYERHFYSSATEKLHLYGRAGLGGAAVFWHHAGWGGLAGLTMLTGPKNHHFEASAGAFLGYESGGPSYKGTLFVLPLLDLGYRYQKPGKGFLFRAKVGTLSLGIGLGYAF